MKDYIFRDLNVLKVSGIFANMQTGKLQEDSFTIPTDTRFNPASQRQIENHVKRYLEYKDFPLIQVKIKDVQYLQNVKTRCHVFDALDVFEIIK